MSTLTKLFQPLQIGDIKLQHRIVMAPLTRFRADDAHVHQDIAAKYYGQRARVSGTLLITEATFIAVEAGGYNNAPGIWSDAQIGGWKKVVDEVHANGSYIYLQLWSLGRGASPAVIRSEGYPYVSASPTVLEGNTEPAQELSKDIKRYLGLYAQAAKNAVFGAGFDGVEIHSANGYLVVQFLQDMTNQQQARFVLEIVDAVVAAIGAKKTAIRFSPWSRFYGMRMKDPLPTFSYVLQELVKHHSDLAYVHFVESRVCGDNDADPAHLTSQPDAVADSNDFAREIWGSRPFIAAGGFKLDTASDFVNKHENTAVAFGRLFLANPDLPDRLRSGSSLNKYDRNTFYTPGPVGYVDYPQAQQVQA